MNILEKIIEQKKSEVRRKKADISISDLQQYPLYEGRNFFLKEFLLDDTKTGIIAEFK